ncbi:hypothetical protein [Caminibacter pacificus]|jgi:hypothetical protein|uniref:Uncharacterized protein n=1 Tax=Caminibacter pacificus TaxID=1424653 RepID=A0AAJ4RDP7_9BACT|nr:hypothetical protein [Caminibacter pacificus]NPA87829.1 hypothetical protein [Campylobacterota bacterium]QCI28473.1 hypothetical protein C6V80_05720 [Caminibacter pacificus]ROR40800.1 hypothetical protein EDC58_0281 [Caminibacter pacificus]
MSIAQKYKELEKYLHKDDAEKINKIFSEILKETFDLVNKKIESKGTFDINDPEEAAAVRAMFEYMLELWNDGEIEEAKEVGYDMAYLVNDPKIKEMFSMYVLGMLDKLDIDTFFEKYVDDSKAYKDMFLAEFNDDIDELVIKHKKQFQEEFSKDAK